MRECEGDSQSESSDSIIHQSKLLYTSKIVYLLVVWRRTPRERREEIVDLSETMEKEERQGKTLILPEIVRPRSVSFGEILPRKDHRKARQRTRCLRYDLIPEWNERDCYDNPTMQPRSYKVTLTFDRPLAR